MILISIYFVQNIDLCWKGNFGQYFDVNAWDFRLGILKDYGRIIRIRALFGVSIMTFYDTVELIPLFV